MVYADGLGTLGGMAKGRESYLRNLGFDRCKKEADLLGWRLARRRVLLLLEWVSGNERGDEGGVFV